MRKLIKFFKERKEYSHLAWWQKPSDECIMGITFYIFPELSVNYDKRAFLDTSDTGDCSSIHIRFSWLLFNSYFAVYFNLHKDHRKWK